MDNLKYFFGKTNYWWSILCIGILITLVGLWMMFFPIEGYMFIARIFGWTLLIAGVFEIIISTTLEKHLSGWGWWLAGGILDVILGIILISNMVLSEMVIPYFFAFVFLFKGIQNIIASFTVMKANTNWWLWLVNGILMIIISWIFFSSVRNPAFITDFLVSIYFIYWGIMMAIISFGMKPTNNTHK